MIIEADEMHTTEQLHYLTNIKRLSKSLLLRMLNFFDIKSLDGGSIELDNSLFKPLKAIKEVIALH